MNKKIFQLIMAMFLVIPGMMAQSVLLEDVTDAMPGTVYVDLSLMGYTSANGQLGAVTIDINYDQNLLEFVGMDNIYPGFELITALENNGLLIVSWFATSTTFPSIDDVLATLEFNYTGSIVADLIISDAEIANLNFVILPADISDQGSITPSSATVGTITVGSTTNAVINDGVSIPVSIEGSGLIGNSITLNIDYDAAMLSYVGSTDGDLTGVVVSENAGVINMLWFGTQDFTSLQVVSNLNFIYLGGGEAALDLAGGSELTTNTIPQNMAFVNGTVSNSMGPFEGTFDIGEATATEDDFTDIEVPITATGISGSMGTLSLVVAYDVDYVSFQGYNGGAGLTVTQEPGIVHIFKIDYSGFTIMDGVLLNLLFDCDTIIAETYVTDVVFNPGCIVQTDELVNVNVEYTDGSISYGGFDVSGVLKYANTSGSVRPITYSTVKLMSSDGLTEIAQTTTDGSGNYTFIGVVPGDYILDAETYKPHGGITLADYGIVRNFVNGGSPLLTGIYWTAADVNLSNTVTLADYGIIRNYVNTGGTVPTWAAPDYIFEQTSITITNNHLTDQDVIGICSGDVNASFTPPVPL